MVEKGGRQRERERHTGEPSTQARSTWPTHIAPTRFLSLTDNCTISLHSLILSSLSPSAYCVLFSMSFPRRSAISLPHLLSLSSSLILPPRHLSRFHVASCCCPTSCTLLPLVYTWYPVGILRPYLFSSLSFSRTLLYTFAPVILVHFLSLCYTFISVSSRALLRLPYSWPLPL